MEILIVALFLMIFMLISHFAVEKLEQNHPLPLSTVYLYKGNNEHRFVELFRTDTTIYLLQTTHNIRIDVSLEMFERDFVKVMV